tara:strand:- start:917 stop:1150 length:234 start_codon:yes stop_codon:yes gene_type:complete
MIEYIVGLFVFNIIGFCYLFNHFTTIYQNQFEFFLTLSLRGTDKILKHIQKEKETVKPARTDEYDWSSITLGLDSEE